MTSSVNFGAKLSCHDPEDGAGVNDWPLGAVDEDDDP